MKKKVYEYEHTQGPIYVSGKTEQGEHYLFLANKNSPMVLADMNRVHTQTPGNARRLAASWNACQSFTTEELEYGMPEKLSETERVWETTLMQAVGEDGPKSVVEAIDAIKLQRDTAWQELREIREAIKADENESTADEVKGLLAKYLTAKRSLEDHGPEGHNVTNQQYVDLRLFLIEAGTALIDFQDITSHHVQWTSRGIEMKAIHDRLAKIESVIARFKENYHVN